MNYLNKEKNSFYAENIEGFYVEGMMKRIWASQLDALVMFDELCKKNNLTWFADSGTLLGAVRHQGFIPWDDDVDVAMLRDDYDKLITCVWKDLPEGYYFHCPGKHPHENMKEFEQPFSRITNALTLDYSKEFLKKFYGCPYPVGIDIFPITALPEEKEERKVLLAVAKILETIFVNYRLFKEKGRILEENLITIEKICNVKIERTGNVYQQLLIIADHISSAYSMKECTDVCNLYFMSMLHQPVMKKEWFESTVLLPFEQLQIPCPKGYQEVLTAYYGDYMTPVSNTAMHDYPYYKSYFYSAAKNNSKERNERETGFAKLLSVPVYEIKELSCFLRTTIAEYYLYYYNGEYCLYRIPFCSDFPFINWKREKAVYHQLTGTGIVSPLIYMQVSNGEKISPAYDESAFFMKPEFVEQREDAIALLHSFHGIGFSGEKAVTPIDMLYFYYHNYKNMFTDWKEFQNLYDAVQDIISLLAEYPVTHTGLTHMNLSPKTFLYHETAQGTEITLLDLKFAGEGDQDWDIAILSANMRCNEEEIAELLAWYYGDSLTNCAPEEYMGIYKKTLLCACISAFVKGIQYRMLCDMVSDYRKMSFQEIKYTKKLISKIKEQEHL